MHVASMLLAVVEEEHHKSETPFYVAACILVGFALAISVVGFAKPNYPSSTGAARGAMALGMLLVAATMAMIIHVSG